MIEIKVEAWQQYAAMPCRDQAQRCRDRHTGRCGDPFCKCSVMTRPNLRRNLSKCISAKELAFIDAVPLVLRQPGHHQFGIDCFAIEYLWNALRHVLCQRWL